MCVILKWCQVRDLNLRHKDFQSSALPTLLHFLAKNKGKLEFFLLVGSFTLKIQWIKDFLIELLTYYINIFQFVKLFCKLLTWIAPRNSPPMYGWMMMLGIAYRVSLSKKIKLLSISLLSQTFFYVIWCLDVINPLNHLSP